MSCTDMNCEFSSDDINIPCFVLQDLQNIVSKLRDQYQYCLYCGCKVSFIHEKNRLFVSGQHQHFFPSSSNIINL
jgi:hypothetical protein